MVKEEFYKKMLALYASTANAERKQELINAFNTVLDDKVDFDALYETVLKENTTNSLPTMSWFLSKKRNKYSNPVTNSLYWTAQIRTKLGDYDFSIEIKKTEEEVIKAAKLKGWRFIKGNRQQILLENGLI